MADTGIGISPDMLPRVFDTFSQAERSIDRSQGALGLGLALVKGLVELHGGTVAAHSDAIGHDTEFTILLPALERPELEPLPPEEVAPGAPAPGQLRILVIEDNRDAAETLCDLLELSGLEVQVAYTGLSGVETAHVLPGRRPMRPRAAGDGRLCRCAGAVPRGDQAQNPPHRDLRLRPGEDRQRSREAGFDLHLTKPVDPEELERLLVR